VVPRLKACVKLLHLGGTSLSFDGSSASDVSHRYLWGQAVDQLLADEQPTSAGTAGNILQALGDNLGTVREVADLSGGATNITNHRRFSAYGNLVISKVATIVTIVQRRVELESIRKESFKSFKAIGKDRDCVNCRLQDFSQSPESRPASSKPAVFLDK